MIILSVMNDNEWLMIIEYKHLLRIHWYSILSLLSIIDNYYFLKKIQICITCKNEVFSFIINIIVSIHQVFLQCYKNL